MDPSCTGGAPVEDLRTLLLQNMTIDMATFKKLRAEAVVVGGGGQRGGASGRVASMPGPACLRAKSVQAEVSKQQRGGMGSGRIVAPCLLGTWRP